MGYAAIQGGRVCGNASSLARGVLRAVEFSKACLVIIMIDWSSVGHVKVAPVGIILRSGEPFRISSKF